MSFEQAASDKRSSRVPKDELKPILFVIAAMTAGVLISSVRLYEEIMPFAFSVTGLFVLRGKSGHRLALSGAAGAWIAFSLFGAVRVFIVYFFLLLIRGITGKLSSTAAAVICGIGAAASGLAINLFLEEGVIEMAYSAAEGIIAFSGVYILKVGLSSPVSLMNDPKRTISEFLCSGAAAVLIIIGLSAFIPPEWNAPLGMVGIVILTSITYFGVGEGIFIACLYAFLVSDTFTLGIQTVGMLSFAAALAGMAAGTERFVMAMLYSAVLIFSRFLAGTESIQIDIFSIFAGAFAFSGLARFWLDGARAKPAAQLNRAALSEEAANRILQSEIELQKSMIKEISKNMTDMPAVKALAPAKEVARQLAADSCVNCAKYRTCWVDEPEKTFGFITRVVDAYRVNFALSYDELPGEFREHCIQPTMLFKMICALLDAIRFRNNSSARGSRARRLMNEQFRHLSRVLDKIYMQFSKGMLIDVQESSWALAAIQSAGIAVDSLIVMEDFYRRQKVFVTAANPLSVDEVKSEIPRHLSDSLHLPIAYDYELSVGGPGGRSHSFCYVEEYKYKIIAGVAGAPKSAVHASGDTSTNVILSNGMHMIGLCDGMGSGERANRQSSRVLNMFEELLNSGFDENSAAQTINSILVLEEGEEIFVTVDLFLFDLNKGLGEFVKAGASPTYVRRGSEVARIEMESLPLGILDEIHVKTSTKAFQRGDCLYFFSDGFFDSYGGNEEMIRLRIIEYDYRNPQKIADALFSDALQMTGGEAVDDVTVVVARIR